MKSTEVNSAEVRRRIFLQEMGIAPVWQIRRAGQEIHADDAHEATALSPSIQQVKKDEPSTAAFPLGQARPDAPLDWEPLKAEVKTCVACPLSIGRTQTVFGIGDERAEWLFIGEGPGRNEDLQGEPFVGQAGKLLDNMLIAMGLMRGKNTYIANIVKCRPTNLQGYDRPPTPLEAATCMGYLKRQIELIQPKILIALGKTAALSLLDLPFETPVSKLRGTVHQWADRPLIVTYHPAYLLRSPQEKSKVWMDMCLALRTYRNE